MEQCVGLDQKVDLHNKIDETCDFNEKDFIFTEEHTNTNYCCNG